MVSILDHKHKFEDTIIKQFTQTLQEQQDIVVLFSPRKTLGNLIITVTQNDAIINSKKKRKTFIMAMYLTNSQCQVRCASYIHISITHV